MINIERRIREISQDGQEALSIQQAIDYRKEKKQLPLKKEPLKGRKKNG